MLFTFVNILPPLIEIPSGNEDIYLTIRNMHLYARFSNLKRPTDLNGKSLWNESKSRLHVIANAICSVVACERFCGSGLLSILATFYLETEFSQMFCGTRFKQK